MSRERQSNQVRLDIKLTTQVSETLESITQETGETKTEVVKGSIRVRRKLLDLIHQEPHLVLASKDADGNLIEVAPLSILE